MFGKFLIFFVIVKLILAYNDVDESTQQLIDSLFIAPKTDVVEVPSRALIDSIFVKPKTNVNAIISDLFKDKVIDAPETSTSDLVIPKVETILPPGVPQIDNCPTGECVPHYLCANNTFITNGETLIDIRFGDDKPQQCHDYLNVCCGTNDQLDEPLATPAPINRPEECGFRNAAGIGFRIHEKDGEAQYAEFPWMVAVLREERDGNKVLTVYHCGGSLIHPQVVLTAAHCVADQDGALLKVRAGEWDTQTMNELWPHQDRCVNKIVIHPDFHKAVLYNDVALVFVREPFDLIENVQTICLPPPNFEFDERHRCVASGWGKNEFGRAGMYQVILKKVELPVVPFAKCEASLRRTRLGRRFKLHTSFMCAGGEPGRDTCKGDGGSPLVCPIGETEHGRYYQAGIVAWGIGCGENNIPGVYVNVALYRNWIDTEMYVRNYNSSSYIPVL